MKALFGGMKKAPGPTPAVTRDDARDAGELEENIRKRRGGAADILTGGMGAEAGATGRTKLG